jgi:hypothetical protein
MITQATRAEVDDRGKTSQAIDVLAAQRHMARMALELMRRLPSRAEELKDLLRLGASCIQIASEHAFGARNEHEAIRAWNECELGVRQIRSSTYRALRRGFITSQVYDQVFRIAAWATRLREDETLCLRRRLRQHSLI